MFIAVHRRYIPLLHPDLTGPASSFVLLVDRLWVQALRARPNTPLANEKRLMLRGMATFVSTRWLWKYNQLLEWDRAPCGLKFFDPEEFHLVNEAQGTFLKPTPSEYRIDMVECLRFISNTLRMDEGGYPELEQAPEGLVDWIPVRPPPNNALTSPSTRHISAMIHTSRHFRQDVSKSIASIVFHRQVPMDVPIDVTGTQQSVPTGDQPTPTKLSKMMENARLFKLEDTFQTRISFIVSKLMAFYEIGCQVSRSLLYYGMISTPFGF